MPTPETTREHSGLPERYAVLLEIGRTLSGTLSPDDLYRAIYQETGKVIEASGFYISLYDHARDLARVVFFADQGREQSVDITYRGSDSNVIRSGKAALIDDEAEVHSLMVLGEDDSEVTRSAISAPLRHKGRVLGVISTQSYKAKMYTAEDMELLQGIADIAAVAVENARHTEQLERRRIEAEKIEEIGRALSASLEPSAVLNMVTEAAVDLLDADGASVWLIEESVATVEASYGEVKLPVGTTSWLLQGDLEQRLMHERKPIKVDDLAGSGLIPDHLRSVLKAGSGAAAPLIVEGRVAGILTAGKVLPMGFAEEDLNVFSRLAAQCSVALENARLHARVQGLSLTDPLTDLPNRRHLKMHLVKEVAAARRGRVLAMVIFDLDNFKQYNDRLGHVAGDEALCSFGRILAGETRAMNLSARLGGDEFVSVLSDTDQEGVVYHTTRIQERVASDPVLSPHNVSVSCGLSFFDPETMESIEDFYRAADAELYRAKEKKVESSSPETPLPA